MLTTHTECWECSGTGMLECDFCFDDVDVDEEDQEPCSECAGFGELDCYYCEGSGELEEEAE